MNKKRLSLSKKTRSKWSNGRSSGSDVGGGLSEKAGRKALNSLHPLEPQLDTKGDKGLNQKTNDARKYV